MKYVSGGAVARVHLGRLVQNFRILDAEAQKHFDVPSNGCVAMVKANAYGHGLTAAAECLAAKAKPLAFGVARLSEAMILRETLGEGLRRKKVSPGLWIFSEVAFEDPETWRLAETHGLTVVVSNMAQLRALARSRVKGLGIHLKFNTGMNRLGFDAPEFPVLRSLLRNLEAKQGIQIHGLCTHFASAEVPRGPRTRAQVERFKELLAFFSHLTPRYIHAANTAAILEGDTIRGLRGVCNVARPGIGLYGYVAPSLVTRAKALGIRPALELSVPVITRRELTRGALVGYGSGGTDDKLSSKLGTRAQSVLAFGYGDGCPRALSGNHLEIAGKAVAVQGRVSMDMLSIGGTFRGRVNLLGESMEQGIFFARNAGTIPYELLTALSTRVTRIYHD